jgi:hypothetical protein
MGKASGSGNSKAIRLLSGDHEENTPLVIFR